MKNKQAALIKQLSNRELLLNLLVTQLIILIAAGILGFFLHNQTASFLSLFHFQPRHLLIGAGAGITVVLVDFYMMKRVPESWQDDGGVNERIFKSLSYPMIVVVALTVAVSEEILFRGVLQVNFGLIWASLIFALVHYRYLFNGFLFISIVMVSFFIGFIFEITGSLTATIVMHFVIDCILGFLVKTKGKQ